MVTLQKSRVMELVAAIESAAPLLEFGEFDLELCEGEQLSNAEFEELQDHCDNLRIERSAEGVLHVGGAAGWVSDQIEDRLRDAIKEWIRAGGGGRSFGSGAGAYLPSGGALIPDLSWFPDEEIPQPGDFESWQAARYGAAPFVVEIQSRGQSARTLRRKMETWIDGDVRLGWLIFPRNRQVEIYRPGEEPETLFDPQTLSGEDVMPGLVITMSDVWI